ncbi:MAG: TetR family transcriptional regulator [Pseudonocardiales bacterium]|nr:MAG: TetR family transcriptional regulator [Pseudonocardiales bacterium]
MTYVMTSKSPRTRMVESTALLLREHGVTGTGMRDIAEHAQAPRGSLQHYFPDGKDQVVSEALVLVGDQATGWLAKVLAADEPMPARAVVAKMFKGWQRAMTTSDYLAGCPIVATVTDAVANDQLRGGAAQAFDRWAVALTAALFRGGLSKSRAGRSALLAISALEGAIVLARAQRSLTPLNDVARELDEYLAGLLEPTG